MRGLNRHLSRRSRAIIALLLFVLLVSPSCASSSATGNAKGHQAEGADGAEATWPGKDGTASTGGQEKPEKNNKKDDDSGKTVEAVLPEDVLSDIELKEKQAPKYTDWYKASDASSKKSLPSDSTVGSIPAVKPFNLGRDPGGPENKTLYLTVPKLGLQKIPVFNEVSEEKLKASVVHIPVTGFPWQKGANTYVAGHRIGYPGTGSSYVFFHLDWLKEGDRIILLDAAGKKYLYRVTEKVRVSPDNVEVMEPEDDRSLVSLQTCTLPDYNQRLIVQAELVEKSG